MNFHQPDPDRSEMLVEAIASNQAFINAHWAWMQGDNNTNGTAKAVLATPEMQAIRVALHAAWQEMGLPLDVWVSPAVAEWVRSK
jgi:hypothetical protein